MQDANTLNDSVMGMLISGCACELIKSKTMEKAKIVPQHKVKIDLMHELIGRWLYRDFD